MDFITWANTQKTTSSHNNDQTKCFGCLTNQVVGCQWDELSQAGQPCVSIWCLFCSKVLYHSSLSHNMYNTIYSNIKTSSLQFITDIFYSSNDGKLDCGAAQTGRQPTKTSDMPEIHPTVWEPNCWLFRQLIRSPCQTRPSKSVAAKPQSVLNWVRLCFIAYPFSFTFIRGWHDECHCCASTDCKVYYAFKVWNNLMLPASLTADRVLLMY